MHGSSFTAKKLKGLMKPALGLFLILASAFSSPAQYKGAPVRRDLLVKALRSKQLQTRDIVAVINKNGVDFILTPETRRLLIAAGARPEVIRAVAGNPRFSSNDDTTFAKSNKAKRTPQPTVANYEELLHQAMSSYKDRKSPQDAVRYLESAVRINPEKPEAYQMLGFVNLYGLNNTVHAEKLMRASYNNGGSAVFRVYHDDADGFNSRCSGSLYISPDIIRFESDDNRHTFETSVGNIDKFRLDTESNRDWKKQSVFKVLLKIGESDMKFRFAPISGKTAESQMIERFVYASKNNVTFRGLAMN
jgi:hypothetical protein